MSFAVVRGAVPPSALDEDDGNGWRRSSYIERGGWVLHLRKDLRTAHLDLMLLAHASLADGAHASAATRRHADAVEALGRRLRAAAERCEGLER